MKRHFVDVECKFEFITDLHANYASQYMLRTAFRFASVAQTSSLRD